jgi:hypothetical protein
MEPDLERFVKVLWGEEPDRVPFYEHLVDNEVIEAIIGEPVPALLEPGVPCSGGLTRTVGQSKSGKTLKVIRGQTVKILSNTMCLTGCAKFCLKI